MVSSKYKLYISNKEMKQNIETEENHQNADLKETISLTPVLDIYFDESFQSKAWQ